MNKDKKTVSFFVNEKLWKEFGKKCIDENKSRSQYLEKFIREFMKK
jgi:uncharacterized membrane protein